MIPADGATVSSKGLAFQWRDFGGGAPYVAHLGHLDPNGQFVLEAFSGSLTAANWTPAAGVTTGNKVWYVEAGSATVRSPAAAGTYYHFTE